MMTPKDKTKHLRTARNTVRHIQRRLLAAADNPYKAAIEQKRYERACSVLAADKLKNS